MAVAPSAAPRALVIFLHGVGSRGDDLMPLAAHLQAAIPGLAFAAPNAPFSFDGGGAGRQWFSVSGVTQANRPDRIIAARAPFDAVLDEELRAAGLAGRRDRAILLGFSQGTIMLLDAIASGRWSPLAAIGSSGRLATRDPLAPNAATPLLLHHGAADPVIPATESVDAGQRLGAAGVPVDIEVEPGLAHTISRRGLARAIAFLQPIVAGLGD